MKRTTIIGICLLTVLLPGAAFAHAGKTTAVMNELAAYHESLFKNPGSPIDTRRLVKLLRAGGDSKTATKIFRASVKLAEKLSAAKSSKQRLELYAQLVDKLAEVHGFHDESGTRIYYCPMAKKKWIAHGETVRNPYMPKMRSCGNAVKH